MLPLTSNFADGRLKYNDMIKNIIFDLGGVLLDLERGNSVKAFEKLGFQDAELLLDNYHPKGILGALEQGLTDRYEVYRYIREQTGKDVPAWKIDDALADFIVGLSPYKLRMLERLKRDYTLLILSNTNPVMLAGINRVWFSQAGKSMGEYFDRMFFSYEMRLLKPDLGIYSKLINDAGIDPEETLFIDDGEKNILEGARFGLKTYMPAPREDLRPPIIKALSLPAGYFD